MFRPARLLLVGHRGAVARRNFSSSTSARALVLNAGSSSVKYGLYDVNKVTREATELCAGLTERIGEPAEATIRHRAADGTSVKAQVDMADHAAALRVIVDQLTAEGGPIAKASDIEVVGHRVVHGGTSMTAPAIIDSTVEAVIEKVIPMAPLHNPAHLQGIRVAREVFSAAPHVAVFDTAFHATMPASAHTYALPKELIEEHGVRRYGFHGTSYTYLLQKAAEHLGRDADSLNLIMCHLGNGASMAVVENGRCVDTTMGLTPLEGLVMGTRAGDVDAGVLAFLGSHLKMSAKEIDTLLNKKSGARAPPRRSRPPWPPPHPSPHPPPPPPGLVGLCGTSDWRAVSAAAADGNADAQLARAVFIERVRKYLGAYLVKLKGKCDALVFAGGIGENDASLREAVCAGLETFGITIDPTKNAMGMVEMQAATGSMVKTMVLPTDEELSIALQSCDATGIIAPAPKKLPARTLPSSMSDATVEELGLRHPSDAGVLKPSALPNRPAAAVDGGAGAVAGLGRAVMIESDSDTTLVEAALMSSLLPRARPDTIGYFRVLSWGEGADPKLAFMRGTEKYSLAERDTFDAMVGINVDEAQQLYAQGQARLIAPAVCPLPPPPPHPSSPSPLTPLTVLQLPMHMQL